MNKKLEETESLTLRPGTGRKPVSEEVVTTVQLLQLMEKNILSHRPSGRVVSDTDCGAIGPGLRAANLLVRLVEGEERWEAPNHPHGVLP
ncbi:hypothetical protein TNCV_100081 [Trichonephila clavipes]|nr:hypothetical protein TNCV_100081 [Trichonephila clavipes]